MSELSPHGHNDEPAVRDYLNIQNYVSALARFIETCETPLTIAVQGGWGSGKTTFLELVEDELTLPVVTFDAWQAAFSSDDLSTIVALVERIMTKLQPPTPDPSQTHASQRLIRTLKAVAFGVGKRSVILAADTFGLRGGNVVEGAIENAEAAWSKMDDDASGEPALVTGADVRKAFRDFIEQTLAAQVGDAVSPDGALGRRIVVVIDNLDRLNPSRAVEVMEALRAVLDAPRCVFVVAVDFDVVVQGLKTKYPGMKGLKARAFFDKIVQLPFHLPVARYETAGLVDALLPEFQGDGVNSDALAALIGSSVGTNPRALKRLANSYRLLQGVRGGASDIQQGLMVLSHLALQVTYPDVYAFVEAEGTQVLANALEVALGGEGAAETLIELVSGWDVTTEDYRLDEILDNVVDLVAAMAPIHTSADGKHVNAGALEAAWQLSALTSSDPSPRRRVDHTPSPAVAQLMKLLVDRFTGDDGITPVPELSRHIRSVRTSAGNGQQVIFALADGVHVIRLQGQARPPRTAKPYVTGGEVPRDLAPDFGAQSIEDWGLRSGQGEPHFEMDTLGRLADELARAVDVSAARILSIGGKQ